MIKKYLTLLIPMLFLVASCSKENDHGKSYLVILSMDGFRWDYAQHANTPVLDSVEKVGVKAVSIQSAYPTKTFPNHYTIATGLYPDHHGLVDNSFYDPDLDRAYWISNRQAVEDGAFYGGEPIWVTAENQGMKVATFFWVGSEAEIQDTRPSIWKKYDGSIPYRARVDSVFNWLSLPESKRPQLVMWYVDEPDHTGHDLGPNAAGTRVMVERLDSLLGYYFARMRELPVFDQINFILTTDHGMAECSEERVIFIDQYIDTADVVRFGGFNPNMNIQVKPGKLDEVYRQLQEAPHLSAWKHGSLPARLHYGTHSRTLDISVVADPGWTISFSWKPRIVPGMHGYDNEFRDMDGIFYAAGPAFKNGYRQPRFQNIDIYPLMANILCLKPAVTDGSMERVRGMLEESKMKSR